MNPMLMMAEQFDTNGSLNGDMPPAAMRSGQLRPGMLLAIGPFAEAIAVQTELISTQSLPIAPPLWRLSVPPGEPTDRMLLMLRHQMSLLCAEIAATQAPSADGWSNPETAHAVLQVWLLLDLSVRENAPHADTNNSVIEQRLNWALQTLQLLDVVAWQHLRVALSPECLIILNAAQQNILDLCRRRLETMLPGPYYVLGFREQAAATASWQKQAATALMALLWTDVPILNSMSQFTRRQPQYYAVGAAVWLPPTGGIKRTLALLTAQELVRRGWEEPMSGPTTNVDTARSGALTATGNIAGSVSGPLQALVEQLLRSGEDLATIVPTPLPIRWRQPRWWRQALQPVRMLLAHHNIQQTKQRTVGRQARQNWLATRLSTWETAWQQFNRTQLVFGTERSQLSVYEEALTLLRQQILEKAQMIDEWLVERAVATTQTANQLQAYTLELEKFCADLPVLSLYGIWQACCQPKQWPRWCWQLSVSLPWRLRNLARILTAHEQVTYDEANGHVLRQLGLALLQDVQLQVAWIQEVRGHLNKLASYLDVQIVHSLEELSTPCDRRRMDVLRHQLLQQDTNRPIDSKNELSRLLQREAADEWIDSSLERVGEEVITRFENSFQLLDTWSVEDWISALFPAGLNGTRNSGAKQSREHAALFDWLNDLLTTAAPLWSPEQQSYNGNMLGQAEMWLVTPNQRTGSRGFAGWWLPQREQPGLATWLSKHPTWSVAESLIQGIIIVQRIAVG